VRAGAARRGRARVESLGAADLSRWASLDEEARYAIVKLADPKRDTTKLRAALAELGMIADQPGTPRS